MKVLLMVGFLTLFATTLFGKDYKTLLEEANAASRKKDFTAAAEKYEEASKAAPDSIRKAEAISGKYQTLRQLKKWKDAENYICEAVEDDLLQPPEIRRLLNSVSADYLWSMQYEFALTLLKQAQNFACPKGSNEYFRTYHYMACIYLRRKKQPEAAIEVLKDVLNIHEQHPANKYAGYAIVGEAYENLGKKDEALLAYKKALAFGKQVTYKFNCSPMEKSIERLSK